MSDSALKVKCDSCGVTFTSPGRDCEGGAPDERLRLPTKSRCPACEELGCAPPPSPCCGDRLEGWRYRGGYACRGCDSEYAVDVVRTFAFGLACERIMRERPKIDLGHVGSPHRRSEVLDLILRAARECGVIQ